MLDHDLGDNLADSGIHTGKHSRKSKGDVDGGTVVDWACGDAD